MRTKNIKDLKVIGGENFPQNWVHYTLTFITNHIWLVKDKSQLKYTERKWPQNHDQASHMDYQDLWDTLSKKKGNTNKKWGSM